MHEPDVKEIEKDLDENSGLVLRSYKKKEKCHGRNKWIRYWKWESSETRCFSRLLVSIWNIVFAYNIIKMMVPHDCYALMEKKRIVTKAT